MHITIRALLIGLLALAPWTALAQEFVVDAGDDVTLECESDGGASYTLNGSVPDGADVTFEWTTAPPVDLEDADTLTPTGTFPAGDTLVTLDAVDPVAMLSGSDSLTVTVEDTQPPVVQALADPMVLWPPNHKLRTVNVRIRVQDACTARDDLQVELVSVESDEPDNGQGDGNTVDDIQDADLGTDDRQVSLRAERSGGGDGRVYTLTYRVTDGGGNQTDAEAKVYVPHDYSNVKDRIEDEMDGDRDGMDNICPRPDVAADEFIDALPKLGSFPDLDSCTSACRTWNRGCNGIIGSTARCVYAEEKALARLNVTDCTALPARSDRKTCSHSERGDMGDSIAQLRQQYTAAKATCDNVAQRCGNACQTLFDPNGSAFDNEGMTGP